MNNSSTISYATLPFDQEFIVHSLSDLGISEYTKLSNRPEYQDSYFECSQGMGSRWRVKRLRLPEIPGSIRDLSLDDFISNLKPQNSMISAKHLLAAANRSLGLKYLSSAEEGMNRGCSLNLSLNDNFDQQSKKEYSSFSGLAKRLENGEKCEELIRQYEINILKFIEDAVFSNRDFPSKPLTMMDFLSSANKIRFLFLDYSGAPPIYDLKQWGSGLGKIPAGNLKVEKIVWLPVLNQFSQQLSDKLDQYIYPSTLNLLVNTIARIHFKNLFDQILDNDSPSRARFNYPHPLLPFDVEIILDSDAISALKVSQYTNLSSLPEYKDSYFEFSYEEGSSCKVKRLKLPKIPASIEISSLEHIISNLKPQDAEFTAEDVLIIGSKNMGLRHLSSVQEAENESMQGMRQGCSLNISLNHNFDWAVIQEESLSRKGCSLRMFSDPASGKTNPYYNLNSRLISRENCDELIERYQNSILEFIESSILMDIYIQSKPLTLREFLSSLHKTQFLLLDYPNSSPCDLKKWGNGLGRVPKTNLGSDRVRWLPPLDTGKWKLSVALDQYIYPSTFDILLKTMARIYLKNFLDHIRER